MTVQGLHHVSLNTNGTSLAALVDFYREHLGLEDEPRPEIPGVGGHWFRVGDLQLHLVDVPPAAEHAPDTPIDPTGPHFCVAVDDLDAAVAALDRAGIEQRHAVQGTSTRQVWIRDPAGNTIELQQGPRP